MTIENEDTQHETYYILTRYQYEDGTLSEPMMPVNCRHRPLKQDKHGGWPVYVTRTNGKPEDNRSCPYCYPVNEVVDNRTAPGA